MRLDKFENKKYLLSKLKTGSESAYSYIFNIYYSEIANYILTLSQNHSIAQEVSQLTFIKFWNKRKVILIHEDKIKTYLFKIAYHLYIDKTREIKRRSALLNSIEYEAISELFEIEPSIFEERLRLVEAEIQKLPTQSKKVFILNKVQGLKYKEISEKLHISIKTVESHMYIALKKIRTELLNTP
jgi:RNA polymerase sigma factor (sigma-70 family)